MPKKIIVIDYHACHPEQCEDGICKAILECERKLITQEAPYEMPDIKSSMCLGCALCMRVCLNGAIRML
jgi:Fe-S-cluster-containing hydrogenase component 2